MSEHNDDVSFRRKQVRNLLHAEDAQSLGGSLGKFIYGLVWCVVAGLIFATLLTLICYSVAGTNALGWFGWLGVYIVVLGALLAYLNFKPKVAKIASTAVRAGDSSSAIDEQLDQFKSQVNQYVSMLSWGPSAVVDGLRGLRGKWTYEQEEAFDRAATLVLDLAQVDGGVEIREVIHPPEDMKVFGSAVDLLAALDWTGRATKGSTIWLSTTGRRKLVQKKLIGTGGAELR
jgi:hypothetical protein